MVKGDKIAEGLRRVRRKRWYLWATLLAYIPSIWVSLRITHSDSDTAVVFGVWCVLVMVTACIAALAVCPGCGNAFHTHGVVPLPVRRCVHCGLHLTADSGLARDPEEEGK